MLKSAPFIPVTPTSPIHGSFAPIHAVRAPIPHGPADVVGSTTSTAKRARTPEPESVSSPTPLRRGTSVTLPAASVAVAVSAIARAVVVAANLSRDRKSTRLNSSHGYISYAVFCLKKKKNNKHLRTSEV